MLMSWLVPDTSYLARLEGWERTPYLPRHCRQPALLRRAAADYQRKWTNSRPKFLESFSTR